MNPPLMTMTDSYCRIDNSDLQLLKMGKGFLRWLKVYDGDLQLMSVTDSN